jgi:hypothetical protein
MRGETQAQQTNKQTNKQGMTLLGKIVVVVWPLAFLHCKSISGPKRKKRRRKTLWKTQKNISPGKKIL